VKDERSQEPLLAHRSHLTTLDTRSARNDPEVSKTM